MRFLRQVWGWMALTAVFCGTPVWGDDSREAVQQAVDAMHRWVGDNPNGQAWQRYLRSEALQAQLEQGEAVDKAVLRSVLERYESGAEGLDRWRFVAVREALSQWLDELDVVEVPDLPQAAREARDRFAPLSAELVAERREATRRAADRLDDYLRRQGRRERRRWEDYLNWDALERQLTEEQPDLRELNTVLEKLYGDEEGLEQPQFTELRDALLGYMNGVLFSSDPGVKEVYRRQLDELAENLEKFARQADGDTSFAIGRALGWLHRANQAPQVVRAVRRYYLQPNLFAEVSEPLAAAGIARPVAEVQAVRDNILGTSIRGTARSFGNLQLDLVPDDERASMELRLAGTAYSTNRGYNRGVTIGSTGTTWLSATKSVSLDEQGLHWWRARAYCRTATRVNSVGARLRLVRKIAWKRIRAQKSQAERIASSHAAQRVAGSMDSRAAGVLTDADRSFQQKFRNPLLRRGETPRQLQFRTTDDRLYVTALQANAYQLGAPDAPPDLEGPFDLAVRLHESMVANFSEASIGGRELTDERAAELVEKYTEEVPEELKINPDQPPWSVTFSTDRPLSVSFAENRVRVSVRGRRFTRGETVVNSEMQISADYKIERNAEGARLIRQGEVTAEYTEGGFENAAKLAIKTLMRKKFGAMFKEEIQFQGLELPGDWAQAGKLRLGQMHCGAGWLALGWNMQDGPPAGEAEDGDRVRTAQAE